MSAARYGKRIKHSSAPIARPTTSTHISTHISTTSQQSSKQSVSHRRLCATTAPESIRELVRSASRSAMRSISITSRHYARILRSVLCSSALDCDGGGGGAEPKYGDPLSSAARCLQMSETFPELHINYVRERLSDAMRCGWLNR